MTRDRVSDVGSPSLMAQHYQGHRGRLRERFREAGAAALSDYELLELVLFAGIPRRDVKPLAKKLLGAFGSFADVLAASPEKLSEFLGESAIVQLKIVEAAALRLSRTRLIGRPALSSWAALLDYCSAAMARSETEEFRVLFLDRKNVLIADEVQSQGTVDHAPVYPREIMKRALALNASALILVHNHPSGDPTPSRADIEMTREIADAARALRVTVHDHIVVGRGGTASFKALGCYNACGHRVDIAVTGQPEPQRMQWPEGAIFTLGHSTLTIERFIAILRNYGIERLVDIRTMPRSRHNPQFNDSALERSLAVECIQYVAMPALGGLRRARKDSPNTGWRNAGFRGYADYMQTAAFEDALEKLIALRRARRVAIMCAEAVPWRCHRSLVADALGVRGIAAVEILSETGWRLHKLTPFAQVEGSRITYPPEQASMV